MKDIVQLSDIQLIPLTKTVRKENISDEIYFSDEYSKYISNSRLKYINPKQDGSPRLYQENPRIESTSLAIGSAVHEVLLQPEEFELAPKIGKPSAKLGQVMDYIPKFLVNGYTLEESIKKAALKAKYYVNSIDSRIEATKAAWIDYSSKLKELKAIPNKKELIILSDKDHDTVERCLKSCYDNRLIMSKLHPTDVFGDQIPSFNEDALFMDYLVVYKGRCFTLKFKMKADNWSINFDDKIVTLNDVKTSGHHIEGFMDGSFINFNYARQMGCYSSILWEYCAKEFGISTKTGWKLNANMLVVETIPNHLSDCFYVSREELARGKRQFDRLMKMVGYYNIFGFDKEVEFV